MVRHASVALSLALALSACASREWQEVRLSLPGSGPEVTYLRRPLPNLWVGTEQERRLRVGGRGEAELPVQMGGRDSVEVYLLPGAPARRLYLREIGTTAVVDLRTLEVAERALPPDSLGPLLGVISSPELSDLRFVPASGALAPRSPDRRTQNPPL